MSTNKTDQQTTGVEFKRGPKAFVERRKAPTRTALLSPDVHTARLSTAAATARFEEFAALARAIHLDVVLHETLGVRSIKPATFFGQGQVADLAERFEEEKVELVLIDTALTPVQQRNLERDLGVKVLDRTALILEIFGERAATREGVLQVELAHLNYQRSRLVRSWTHLERQRGGFGFLGGPGETQIEADRRQLRERISSLEKRIEKIRKTRAMQRKPRDAVPFPLVALVGYTNAGKSTIFNLLTGATVMARDVLFATLDTTVRKVVLPHGKKIILSDTVGFIADLPTDLVAAFRATLEEVVLADVILHVRDISNPNHEAQARDVLEVVKGLGVNPDETPLIEVWNKADLVDERALGALRPAGRVETGIAVSATTGQGIDALLGAIEATLGKGSRTFNVFIPHENGQERGWLYEHCEVLGQEGTSQNDTGTFYFVRVPPRHMDGFLTRFSGRLSRPVSKEAR